MGNLYTKFEVCIYTRDEDIKGEAKCSLRYLGVTQGRR